jgi:DUF971 family protein
MQPRLEVDPEEGLLIEWPDGHQSRYAFAALRGICPCAACRDERGRPGVLRVLTQNAPNANVLRRVDPVGNYAIALLWGDGHNTGIYPFEYLRDRCDCLACRTAKPGEER